MAGLFVASRSDGKRWQQILAGLLLEETLLQPGKKAGKPNGKRYKHYGRQNLMVLQPFFGEHAFQGRTAGVRDAMSRG